MARVCVRCFRTAFIRTQANVAANGARMAVTISLPLSTMAAPTFGRFAKEPESFVQQALIRCPSPPVHSPTSVRLLLLRVIVLFVIGEQQRAQLERLDAKSQQFVPFLNGISAGEIDFSRDGKWVTYVSYPGSFLWRSRSDGSEKLQLTYAPVNVAMPRWSPDGKQIVYSCVLPGKSPKVCIVSADGGATGEVQIDEQHWLDDPQWSEYGRSLILPLSPPGITSTRPQDYSVGLFDLQAKKITTLPGSEGMLGPRWSPDGRYILTFSVDDKRAML